MSGSWGRLAAIALLGAGALGAAQAKRVVIVKVDGLGASVLEHYLAARNPATGKSRLPWIDYVFVQNGARVANFYVRGISLSVPSWSMLDSGRPPVIRGNAEFDRLTGRIYDYMNFFPFYFLNARNSRADMPGVEVLDEAGIPLFIDEYQPIECLQAMELFQRGVRWRTLKSTLPEKFSRTPRELFDEWQIGFRVIDAVAEQQERELIAALAQDRALYLDLFVGDYDHTAHLTNDEPSIVRVLDKVDRLIGHIWGAIEQSPLGAQTVLALVSDHGMNSDPSAYSQGYNLLNFFGSAAGGGHHVLTNRHPEADYKLRGLDPFVSRVVTPSKESFYLRDEADEYPTAWMDLDGNERASIYLRNSDINAMHILAKQPRAVAVPELVRIIDAHRRDWRRTAAELDDELPALERAVARKRLALGPQPKHLTRAQYAAGVLDGWVRLKAFIELCERHYRDYREYRRWLGVVLEAREGDIASGRLKADALIPKGVSLDRNSVYQLQNYVVNAAGPQGRFERLNYFDLLAGIRVRNNVQRGVSSKPVDFIATEIALAAIAPALAADERPDCDAVWLYGSRDRQALILSRRNSRALRYLPVRNLRQDAAGRIEFERMEFVPGLPLGYLEDGASADWLGRWHKEAEWLQKVHRMRYSNGIIGLAQQFAPFEIGEKGELWEGAGADTPLLRRFAERLRDTTSADFMVAANDQWNFNVRSFNPGGNHGSFLRISTHSTLMFAGAGIPKGEVVETPYDSLSFVPTLAALTGLGNPQSYPGPVIEAVISSPQRRDAHGSQDCGRLSSGTAQPF